MVKKKSQQPCSYKEFCLLSEPNASCSLEDQGECDEAQRIKELMSKPCPIAVREGYKPENCGCEMMIIRANLPSEVEDCSEICQGTSREDIKSLHRYINKYKRDHLQVNRDGLTEIFLEIKRLKSKK